MSMLERIDLALLPAEADAIEADVYLVVDVLRATTTIATLFARGLRSLMVAESLELSRELARRDGRLLFGEVGGLPPEGFDFGNSPVEARAADVAGHDAVLFTTNGTRALCRFGERGAVIAASVANTAFVASHSARTYRHAAIVCAGEAGGRRFALEDFAAAGMIAAALFAAAPGASLGDAAALARHTPDLDALIGLAAHARVLTQLGLGEDVAFAAEPDTSATIPAVVSCGDGWAKLKDLAAEAN
jgi:2-phosphosulfolactate phosphatase